MSQPRQLHPDSAGVIHPDRESALAATIALGEKQKADKISSSNHKRKTRKAGRKGKSKTGRKPRQKKA